MIFYIPYVWNVTITRRQTTCIVLLHLWEHKLSYIFLCVWKAGVLICVLADRFFLSGVTGASADGKSDGQARGGPGGGEWSGGGGQGVHEGHRFHQSLQEYEGDPWYDLMIASNILYP